MSSHPYATKYNPCVCVAHKHHTHRWR